MKEKLIKIGFVEPKSNLFVIEIGGYQISITYNLGKPENSKIDYGSKIKVWHKTTSNLAKDENLVVLECVVRLLQKGYRPESIELEKTWKSGHGTSGRLDILITDEKSDVFAMIECKTWGEEYEKERNNLLENGGQLFTYLVQERSTKFLILYTSLISENVECQSECIDLTTVEGSNNEELHKSWNKTFVTGGIFEVEASPYNIQRVELKKSDLKELDENSGKGLFNSFAEILRRHAISDKSNAFNKIFNLFVCKIYDEDTHHLNDILDFQWKPNDNYESLIKRLSYLYQHGVSDYLGMSIEDEYFSPYSEFAFMDIYNKQSYITNFTIIREIVELLQRYQIKYTQKHQFLGDFFEDLLNSGIKQEAGQFFTPTPLARFFIRAIPIKQLVEKAINNKSQEIIPYVIDFACGAGHFLTESIDEIEGVLKLVDYKHLVGRAQKHFLAIRDNFYWAKDYVYGIEKDYRLAKTTKIALFLNGDGDAIIANADGLGSFQKEPNFHGQLKKEQPGQILGHFDILVSNPPFSISGFKKDLQNEKDFALAEKVTTKSSEIECLFLERAFQLLKDDGYLGIILPLSILNNESSVYSSARRILFFCFEVIAVVELRDKTFKPTNTATTALFARKRNMDAITGSIKALRNLSEMKAKVKLADISSKTQIPAEHIQESITNDASILETMTSDFTTNGLLKINSLTYRVLLQIIEQNRGVYLGYAGEKKDQEDFLGYRFSKSRGQEGIDILKTDSGEIATKLFSSRGEEDKSKLDYYIRNAFLGKEPEIDESIAPNLTRVTFLEAIGKSATLVMDNPSKFFSSRHLSVESNSPFGDFIDNYEQIEISLSKLRKSDDLFYTTGLTYSKQSEEVPYQTQNRVLTASNLSLEKARVDLSEKLLYLRDEFTVPNELLPRSGDIIISNASGSLKHLGKVIWVDENLDNHVVGGFLGIFRFRDRDLAKAVFYRLLSEKFRAFVAGLKGQNINNLDIDKIDDFGLTVPRDLDKFVKDALDREKELEKINEALAKIK
ncbi:N-6 DNA methylase [Candidatus Poribacteria bacterium]|nr:N-6 DNA methylase [Candidatus Poribacteria bacterium]